MNSKKSTAKHANLWQSTVSAVNGFVDAIRTEHKVRQVLAAMICVVAVCIVADVGYFQILMVIFSWVICFICEMFNTALEKALDYSSKTEYHPLVRQGKDYAAACTFVSIVFASLLALFVLWDRVFDGGGGIERIQEPLPWEAPAAGEG
jgi:diacylglycerol kinase